MRKALAALAFIFLLAPCLPALATGQPKFLRPAFEHINSEIGLTGQSIYAVMQDSKGFMWFGSENGLVRYDGYRFRAWFSNPDDPSSISYSAINYIYEDPKGFIWLGTGRGLSRFDPSTEKFSRYINDPNNPESLAENRVQAILPAEEGRLWVATLGGLSLLDPKTGKFTNFGQRPDDPKSLPNGQVRSLAQDKVGSLWVGTSGGLCRLDRKTGFFEPFGEGRDNPGNLYGESVTALHVDRAGFLWAGTQGGGLRRLDTKSGQILHYTKRDNDPKSISHNFITFIKEDRQERLWVGTRGGGLNLFNPVDQTFTSFNIDPSNPYGISENSLLSFWEDKTGALWIGTLTDGVNKVDPNAIKFIPYRHNPAAPQGLGGNKIRGMCEDRSGGVWIAYSDGGLDRLDPKTELFEHFRQNIKDPGGLKGGVVTSVLEDRSGKIWVGTWDAGLHLFNTKDKSFSQVRLSPENQPASGDELILALHEDPRGVLWVGTFGSGLFRHDPATGTFTRYSYDPMIPGSLADNRVLAIHTDSKGSLWVSVVGKGVERLIPESGLFEHFEHRDGDSSSLRANTVYCIANDKAGNLWFGTIGGIDRYDHASGRFQHPEMSLETVNETVFGILEDDSGYLWLSGNKGLTRYSPKTSAFRLFDRKDGLQATSFAPLSYLKTRNGELYFGGNNGLNRFDPKKIRLNPNPPPVVFTDFLLSHKSVKPGSDSVLKRPIELVQKIVLDHSQAVFSIEFSALNFAVPEKNRFAYMLEGWDSRWIYTDSKHRIATYTNLPPNSYVFRVKASNNDGVWNEKGASLAITITPPWWETLQFRLLMALLLSFLFFGGYRARVRAVERRNRMLKRMVEERTADLLRANARLTEEMESHTRTTLALDFERQQFLSIFDASNEMIYVSDPATYEILYTNKTIRDLLGDIKGEKCHKAFQHLEAPCDFCTNKMIFGENLGKSHSWEKQNLVSGRWYRCFDRAIRWPDGRMVRYEMAVDIHERKIVEEELKLAKEKAEAASAEKSRFLANMSHEIRTPMTIIMGMTQLALETDLSEKQRECLEPVLDSAKSLLNLINDILDVSKIEARKLELVNIDFSLADLVNVTARAFRFEATAKGLDLGVFIAQETPTVLRGDPHRLRQVLVNLLGNAIKFTEKGYVNLSISPVQQEEAAEAKDIGQSAGGNHPTSTPTHTILFEITDTGMGIPTEKQELIFDHFTQAEDFLTRTHGGTGLGLSISKKLVELMHGEIRVKSQPGLGSTFFFTACFEEGKSSEILAAEDAPPDLKPLDVLVVEDNPVIRQLLNLFLMRCGHRPHSVENGEAALFHLEHNTVDLILMDIQMPGLNGMETTSRLRESKGWATPADTPVVALTAHSIKGDRERFLEAGLDDYVAKPVDVPILMETIARVITRKIGQKASPGQIETAKPASGPTPDSIFDREWLLERLGFNLESLQKVMELFLETVPGRLAALNEAAKSGTLEEIRRSAHSVKGLAVQMGASRTRDAAERLEKAAESGDEALAKELCPALSDALRELIGEIASANS